MSRFSNSRKQCFLDQVPTASLDSPTDLLSQRSKFNFAYMDFNQKAGQRFEDWSGVQLEKLLNKLHEYSKEPLSHWEKERIGKKGNTVLEIYSKFPLRSDFIHPKHVPHQVKWGRFRLESSVRLIGFVIPHTYNQKEQGSTGHHFDCNTFYVTFLDAHHCFYKNR